MSLQVWLPLNGNLDNQGVSGLTFSNVSSSNTTVSTSGKIGSCYTNNSTTAGGLVSNTTINLGQKQSMFCWANFTSFNSGSSLSAVLGQHRYPNNTGMGITTKYVSSTSGYLSVNTGNGTSRTYNTYCGKTLLTAGNWYHIGYTYDGATIKLYVNGVLDGSHAYSGMSVPADYLQIFAWSFGSSTGTNLYSEYKHVGSINDVRIYDHCLSEKEVKEISQALILHYPLRNPMYESTTNIVSLPKTGTAYSTTSWDSSLHPKAISVSGWSYGLNTGVSSPTTGYHAHWQMIDDIPTMVFPNINSTISSNIKGRWLGIHSDANLQTKIGPSTTYTVSFDARGSIDGMTIRSGLHYYNTATSSTDFHDGQKNIILNTSWARYSYTYTTLSTFSTSQAARIYLYGHYGIEGISYVRNVQVEIKNHETLLANGSRSITQMYDCAGLQSPATITGSLSVNKDPEVSRNEHSIIFNGSSYIRTGNISIPTVNTISLWVNRTNSGHVLDWRSSDGGTGLQPLYFDGSGKIQYWSSAGGSVQSEYFSYAFAANTWYHVVMVCEGSTVKLYVNGVLQGSKATGISAGWSYPLTVGARVNNANIINAKISDLRIYATALSASDIATLYRARGSVDSKKNCWAYEFIQEDTGSMKIYNSGVWNFADMLETDDGEDTSIYEI